MCSIGICMHSVWHVLKVCALSTCFGVWVTHRHCCVPLAALASLAWTWAAKLVNLPFFKNVELELKALSRDFPRFLHDVHSNCTTNNIPTTLIQFFTRPLQTFSADLKVLSWAGAEGFRAVSAPAMDVIRAYKDNQNFCCQLCLFGTCFQTKLIGQSERLVLFWRIPHRFLLSTSQTTGLAETVMFSYVFKAPVLNLRAPVAKAVRFFCRFFIFGLINLSTEEIPQNLCEIFEILRVFVEFITTDLLWFSKSANLAFFDIDCYSCIGLAIFASHHMAFCGLTRHDCFNMFSLESVKRLAVGYLQLLYVTEPEDDGRFDSNKNNTLVDHICRAPFIVLPVGPLGLLLDICPFQQVGFWIEDFGGISILVPPRIQFFRLFCHCKLAQVVGPEGGTCPMASTGWLTTFFCWELRFGCCQAARPWSSLPFWAVARAQRHWPDWWKRATWRHPGVFREAKQDYCGVLGMSIFVMVIARCWCEGVWRGEVSRALSLVACSLATTYIMQNHASYCE